MLIHDNDDDNDNNNDKDNDDDDDDGTLEDTKGILGDTRGLGDTHKHGKQFYNTQNHVYTTIRLFRTCYFCSQFWK